MKRGTKWMTKRKRLDLKEKQTEGNTREDYEMEKGIRILNIIPLIPLGGVHISISYI